MADSNLLMAESDDQKMIHSASVNPDAEQARLDNPDEESRQGEHISPCDLQGEQRQEWLNILWNEFSLTSKNGLVSVQDVERLVERLHVEGSVANIPFLVEESQRTGAKLTFEDVVSICDKLSSNSSFEFGENQGHQNHVREVPLNPLQFVIAKLTCKVPDEPDTVFVLNRQYFKELRPKTTFTIVTILLTTIVTGSLISLVCGLWHNNSTTNFDNAGIHTFESIFTIIGSLRESTLSGAQVQVTNDLQNVGAFFDSDIAQRHIEIQRFMNRWAGAMDRSITGIEEIHREFSHGIIEATLSSAVLIALETNATTLADFNTFVGYIRSVANGYSVSVLNTTNFTAVTPACSEGANISVATGYKPAMDSEGDAMVMVWPNSTAGVCLTVNTDLAATARAATARGFEDLRQQIDSSFLTFFGMDTATGTVIPDSVSSDCTTLDGDYLCGNLASLVPATPGTLSYVQGTTFQGTPSNILAMRRSGSAVDAVFIALNTDVFNRVQLAEYLSMTAVINAIANESGFSYNWATWNPVTKQPVVQSVPPVRPGECADGCQRMPRSAQYLIDSLTQKTIVSDLVPDYRPRPVMAAAYYNADLDASFAMERDLVSVGEYITQILISFASDVNALDLGFRIDFVRFDNHLPICDYDPYVAPPAGVAYYGNASAEGVYFRFDLQTCIAAPQNPVNTPISVLTGAGDSFPTEFLWNLLTRRPSETRESMHVFGSTHDVMYAYMEDLGLALIVSFRRTNQIRDAILEFMGISLAILVGCLGLLWIANSSPLQVIEKEYSDGRSKMEVDKKKFQALVGDVLPPQLSDRVMRGQKLIADSQSGICFVVGDMCAFCELTASMNARQTVRLATYSFYCLETVAAHFSMLRLSSIGDSIILYGDYNKQTHPAVRGIQLAMTMVQLFSKQFSHYPERIKTLREAFKDRLMSETPFQVGALRFGIHCGSVVSGMIDTGRAPRFDFFGLTPALAWRVCQTSSPFRIHVTQAVRDVVASQDKKKCFQFEPPRKTIVKGQATITTHFVKSAVQPIPSELLESLGIDNAVRVVRFDRSQGSKGEEQSEMSYTSSHSGQSQKVR